MRGLRRKMRNLSFHHSQLPQAGPLVARRDLTRQYTKLVDVPFADEHLDRGYQIVGVSRTVPPSLGPQSFDFKIDGSDISTVSHYPSPSQCRLLTYASKMAVSRQSWRDVGNLAARATQPSRVEAALLAAAAALGRAPKAAIKSRQIC
jgi:hypothetical protein